MFSCTDTDDLFDVNSELLPVAALWEDVGLALKLKPHVLSTIKKDHTDAKACLRNVLMEWLKKGYNTTRFGVPSWKLLVAAVAHPAGGNNRALAEQIAKKYNGKCRTCFIAVGTSKCRHVQYLTPP